MEYFTALVGLLVVYAYALVIGYAFYKDRWDSRSYTGKAMIFMAYFIFISLSLILYALFVYLIKINNL